MSASVRGTALGLRGGGLARSLLAALALSLLHVHAPSFARADARSAHKADARAHKGKRAGKAKSAQSDQADADFAAAINADTLSTPETAEADKARGGPAPDALIALVKPRLRKVAVAKFGGKDGELLRRTVLEVLSAQTDLELLSFRDIEVVAHRIGIGQSSSDDRTRLAAELGVYAWIDGDSDKADVRLSDSHDATLATLEFDAAHAEAQTRERLWNEVGRFISDEGLREYRVTHARDAAKQVLAAQSQGIVRQQEIAARHAQERARRLAVLKGKAQARLEQQAAELRRQVTVAAEHRRQQEDQARKAELAQQAEMARQAQLAQQAQQAEAARQAEMARQAQLAQQAQPAPAMYPPAGYQYPAQQAPAANAYGGGYGAPPPPSGNFGPAPAQAAPPAAPPPGAAGPEVDGISPETRQWLLEHRARTQGGAQ